MAEPKGVMIYGETANGNLSSITTEILGCGRRLANDLKEELSCVLIGNQLGETTRKAIAYGADKVYAIEDALFKEYQTDSYITAIAKLAKDISPRILLFGQTSIGRDLAPRLAFRLGVSLSMDCLDLNINPSTRLLEQTKPVYGGNARAIFTSDTIPQIATVRQKAMSPLAPDESRKGETISFKVEVDPSQIRTRLIETVKEQVAGIKLEDATVVVSGGRGIGGPEGFKQLEELAKALKGAVGASRPPCDNKWMPDTSQVGLTGKIVTPELYIAVAISGASQHLAGCSGSKNIIAINKDPEANIFKEARFGVVGDWKQILPALTQRVKELLAG
jgi:electron transfer flavoprotein alpha subunit